jgi:hypothetical protein
LNWLRPFAPNCLQVLFIRRSPLIRLSADFLFLLNSFPPLCRPQIEILESACRPVIPGGGGGGGGGGGESDPVAYQPPDISRRRQTRDGKTQNQDVNFFFSFSTKTKSMLSRMDH